MAMVRSAPTSCTSRPTPRTRTEKITNPPGTNTPGNWSGITLIGTRCRPACGPAEYRWGYNRMMTVERLFGAGDPIGGTAHKFSSGSFTEGRIAAKAAVKYVNDLGNDQPQVSAAEYEDLKKTVYKPLENYAVGRNEIVAGTVSPS